MDKQIFRKVSMERLSSPEQLDSLLRVTSPRGWLALTAIILLIGAAIGWGFNGSIATKVNGPGVLIQPGGIHQVFSSSSGQITDVRALNDDLIEKGDVLARIYQPEMIQEMKQLKNEIADLEVALASGDETVNVTETQNRLNEREAAFLQLKLDYELASKVVSPFSGRVLEVATKKGDSIEEGMPMVTMELNTEDNSGLVALMYMPAAEKHTVLPGMEVQISPTTVNKEEYGYMVGHVISISEFPASRQGMMITLGNESLVDQLAGAGVSHEVLIDLTPVMEEASGYKWSTNQGPPVEIHSGTLAEISIIQKEERPITSVIPQIK